jgi:hypothetical protein
MGAEAIVTLLVFAGILGAVSGLWAADREIEKLEDRLLELERELLSKKLDAVIDNIEREII